ncbi:WW domain binding protein-2 [Schizosaccharomyces cryophilus OY26]|uniref:WW domain binding protein-2 n=1 Tax=Schizosaccharomyces cryophilus (strain OY26 / ATCC MYA-4695 / CBS 11777 / NBRC 106824 / NRRL Y48691) TaxID=653667 RepID=S9XBC4_SCHCR|nr:WW domain binding protein-2 [Schizosaccharomyces cryophilus OY26]EPY51061.1 WW domain binding protein-2 [Schizosaccharomyces cryophilus OY26]
MSINWVTYKEGSFKEPLLLENECVFSHYNGIALSLLCNPPSAKSWTSTKGCLYLTNQRIIYITDEENNTFADFQVPISNIKDTKLNQPFFGANYYSGVVMPVKNGGIPSEAEVKFQFNEGGIFDFVECWNRLLQRYQEVDSASRVQHLDPLPPYHRPSSSQDQPPQYDEAIKQV